MSNIRQIKRRIKGIQSTAKITKAMEMIAASKMRKAQERGIQGRDYANKLTQVISDLVGMTQESSTTYPLMQQREVINNIGIIHITADRGQTGGLLANLNRSAAKFILEQGKPTSIISVGRRGADFMRRSQQNVIAEFSGLGDYPTQLATLPISRIAVDDFIEHKLDAVYISYAQFVSTAVQKPVIEQLLPIVPPHNEEEELVSDCIFEPSKDEILSKLLPRYVEMKVYHAILEAIASEQSARMLAMRNATDNAMELISELTLVYNKARQESITTELLDIISGTAALS